ncbi:helix-turn-helix domain-containing protein [Parvularcula sp. IMCC14364]|uniref:helix-turn-helix domain-containing protein n=1 Tax=Parvularcula sp. IMCC14364 TaxID=3067902 RepID=UPI0027415131|nr:helix-turn-helix domain-containing protein [Parvularcula sp. IMCC14364]
MPEKSDHHSRFPASPYLLVQEAADYLRLSVTTMKRMRIDGTGPIYRKHMGHVVYHINDLEKWSEGHMYTSTGGAGI